MSIDQAIEATRGVVPSGSEIERKLAGLTAAASQISDQVGQQISRIEEIRRALPKEIDEAATKKLEEEIGPLAARISYRLNRSEKNKVIWLRGIAAVIGCGLVLAMDFRVLDLLETYQNGANWIGREGRLADILNVLAGGLAAAAGSSYWHDQLARLRKIKSAMEKN